MRFGIPLLGQRVAPRCTIADSVLLLTIKHRRILEESRVLLDGGTWMDLARILTDEDVDALVCGGISRPNREAALSQEVQVIDNVAGTAEAVVEALRDGGLRSGFGLAAPEEPPAASGGRGGSHLHQGTAETRTDGGRERRGSDNQPGLIDCLACTDRVCLRPEPCPHLPPSSQATDLESAKTLEAAWEVACEEERTLCRLAELVYFALEMGYTKLGVAFCVDLLKPASVLTGVLRRFFEVVPVCCKVGGLAAGEPTVMGPRQSRSGPRHQEAACDPLGLAAVLNAAHTDFNVLVGLCVGVDGIFSRASVAPVTTLFVKDKSLANNPIGAVYSHYHLEGI
jgi:uncharacterized metal-binding protein/predicted Fe-Mo cluster-binding NifX family protein